MMTSLCWNCVSRATSFSCTYVVIFVIIISAKCAIWWWLWLCARVYASMAHHSSEIVHHIRLHLNCMISSPSWVLFFLWNKFDESLLMKFLCCYGSCIQWIEMFWWCIRLCYVFGVCLVISKFWWWKCPKVSWICSRLFIWAM